MSTTVQADKATAIEMMKAGIWDIHQGITKREEKPAQNEESIMKGTLPKYKYVAQLGQRYLLQRALEQHLGRYRRTNERIARVVREDQFHAFKAAADLRFFGIDPESVKSLSSTLSMIGFFDRIAATNPDFLLAIQYVIEGSNNGARHIAKAVRNAYALEGTDGTWHLDPYGEKQRDRWKAFGETFNACDFSTEELQTMISIGRETFGYLNAVGNESHAQPELN